MLSPQIFFELLQKHGIDFFTGVPDSLLKDICLYIEENSDKGRHIIAANEGSAVGLACGYHLATGRVPLVYMQNSGLGNAINPITSLADEEVYGIPMLLMVGWRGEPGIPDEPQHKKMGKVTKSLLEAMDVPYFIVSDSPDKTEDTLAKAKELAVSRGGPVALLIKKGTFSKYPGRSEESSLYEMARERALEVLIGEITERDVVVSTTGKISRELFDLRRKNKHLHRQDFLTVGSMGHASQIALGISLETQKKVVCIDGDGAVLMHLGGLATCGSSGQKNFIHVVLNNGCHESVGGQPTICFDIDIPKIALASGYRHAETADTEEALLEAWKRLYALDGPCLLEVRINKQSRDDLGRPDKTPQENKADFMDFLAS